jgi:sulfotransferase family protein
VFGFLREIADRENKPIWAEKTATSIYHLEAIRRLCQDKCRFICITRHALDVIQSMHDLTTHMGAYLPELHQYCQRYANQSEAFAHAWKDANGAVQTLLETSPDQVITLRYEDLVAGTTDELNRIFEFLGVGAAGDTIVSRALSNSESVGLGDWKAFERETVSTESVGRGSELDPWIKQKIAPIIDPTLLDLGYQGVGRKSANEQRLHEISRMVAKMKMSNPEKT